MRSVWAGDDRGQSEVIGLVLLMAITVVSAGIVVGVGAPGLDGVQSTAMTGAAERSMTQLDSDASLVAFGSSDSRQVTLTGSPDALRTVDGDAGWVNVTLRDPETGAVEAVLLNATLGAVVYRDGETSVAYQGGGVWTRTDAGSSMVTPPEVHFRDRTLTLPLITVTGSGYTDETVVVRPGGPTTVSYPNEALATSNPVEDAVIVVTVNSEYYDAWGRFLAGRTGGTVAYDHDAQTATVSLFAPSEIDFDHVVLATVEDGITYNGIKEGDLKPVKDGISHPSADPLIESLVDDCVSGAMACAPVTGTDLTGPETYFVDGAFDGDLTVNTTDGNVSLVVNGRFAPDTVTVVGSGSFTVYVRGRVAVSGGDAVNVGGTASTTRVVVHSDGDVDFNGKYRFVGFLYAPGSDIDLNGGGGPVVNFEGAIIGETITINGKPNNFQYEPSVLGIDLDVSTSTDPRLTYLHVSVTPIAVSDD